MLRKRKTRLWVEQLEGRITPTLAIKLAGGVLTISGTPNDVRAPIGGNAAELDVTQTANNTIQVQTKNAGHTTTTTYGIYVAPSGLNITLSNHQNNNISVDLGTHVYSSNILINVGIGKLNTVVGQNPITISDGTLNGTLTLSGGAGQELFVLGSPATTLAIGGNVTVTGTGASLSNSSPSNEFSVTASPTGPTSLARNVTLAGIQTILLGSGPGNSTTIGGSVVASSSLINVGEYLDLNNATVGGDVTLIGTSDSGSVLPSSNTVGGDFFEADLGTTIKGNLNTYLGQGLNTTELLAGSTLQGNLTYTGGSGSQSAAIPGSTDNFEEVQGEVDGSVSVTISNGGSSTWLFTGLIAGNVSYVGSNGLNDLGLGTELGGPGAFNGTVSGNVSITLGNGVNTMEVVRAAVLNGSSVSFTSGTGNDNLQFDVGGNYKLNVNMGGGTDTVNLGGFSFGAATVDFGVDTSTGDSWTPPSPTTPLVLKNLH